MKIESATKSGRGNSTLADMPAETLVRALEELGIGSWWLQSETSLEGWENDEQVFGRLGGVMLGDCEFEVLQHQSCSSSPYTDLATPQSILWLTGARAFSDKAVAQCFSTSPPEHGQTLAKAYLQNPTISAPSLGMVRSGALDFLSDAHFSLPVRNITRRLRGQEQKVYQYVFDERNPWARPTATASRAHHALDLLPIFGGYEDDVNDGMKYVGRKLRHNWIMFVNGEQPWDSGKVYGYGPQGKCAELSEEEYAQRRRAEHFNLLDMAGRPVFDRIWGRLVGAAGTSLAAPASQEEAESKARL